MESCAQLVTAALMEYPMKDLFKSIEAPGLEAIQERRKSERKDCSIKANYMVKARWHQGSIRNISASGAYIAPIKGKRFSPGENIFLVARIRFLREQLRGKIAWVGPNGMGVEFHTPESL